MRNLFAQIFTRDPLVSLESGVELIQLLKRHIPAAFPSRWDNFDFVSRSWSFDDLGQTWNLEDFFWESDPPEIAKGAVFKRTYPTDTHGVVSLELDPESAPVDSVAIFLHEIAVRLTGEYGYIHSLPADGSAETSAFLHVAPQDLSKCLPDIWWGSILGPPYVELIGEERIRTAPAYRVSRLADRTYWLQLSAQPPYVTNLGAGDELDFRAAQLQQHLGEDLFWAVGRTSFRVPRFC